MMAAEPHGWRMHTDDQSLWMNGRAWVSRLREQEQQRLVGERARARAAEMFSLLLGARHPDCALHVLAGKTDELRWIFFHLSRRSLPRCLIAELAHEAVTHAEEPQWLVRLRARTDWSPCASWKMEERDDGSTAWVRRQPSLASVCVDDLQSAVEQCSLGDSSEGRLPLRKAVEGARVTFVLHGVRTSGVIIKGANPSDDPPRARVRHATAACWLEVKHLLTDGDTVDVDTNADGAGHGGQRQEDSG